MPREESEYLLDMVLAARKALSFTEGMSFVDFERDERTILPDLIALVEPLIPPEAG